MKFVSLLILCAISLDATSQSAYMDAKNLRELRVGSSFFPQGKTIKLPENDEVYELLRNYTPDDVDQKSEMRAYFLDNPFMRWDTAQTPQGNTTSKAISKGLASIGGIDVTNVANGIAMFMIQRAKQELTIAFFERFKTFVAKNEEFQVLFPKTTDNLGNLLAYKYPEMLPTLRIGFFEDLRTITIRLDDVLELPRYQELLKTLPEMRIAIRSLRIVHQLESGESHAAELFSEFASLKEWDDPYASTELKNTGNAVKFADILSSSLRMPGAAGTIERAWIPPRDAASLIKNDTLFRIYLGLLYQSVKMRNIRFDVKGVTKPFTGMMQKQSDNLIVFESKVIEFAQLADKVDKVRKDLKIKQDSAIKIENDDYYSYVSTSIDIIDYGFDVVRLFDRDFAGTDYTSIVRKCNGLYRNIYKQEYTQAVTNVMAIYRGVHDLVNHRFKHSPALANTKLAGKDVEDVAPGDTTVVFTVLPGHADSIQRNQLVTIIKSKNILARFGKFIEEATKYAVFMGNMVKADTPEEVAHIMENAVLPVGSSSIKKNSYYNISIQSYLGAYRLLHEPKNNLTSTWSNTYGMSAPIGIAFSKGFERCGSVSLFAALFDLGAIVDYQLKRDSVVDDNGQITEAIRKDYKIALGQIISPGIYAVYGFPYNLPLSFGIGGQYGPGLTSISAAGETVVNNPSWRWNAFIGIDIPFFNLGNRNRDYHKK